MQSLDATSLVLDTVLEGHCDGLITCTSLSQESIIENFYHINLMNILTHFIVATFISFFLRLEFFCRHQIIDLKLERFSLLLL